MNTVQGTQEWQDARSRCIVTASVLPCLFGIGYKSRKELWREKALGKVTQFSTYALAVMDRGTKMEAEARDIFAYWYDHPVKETGFHRLPGEVARGGSPDGIINTVWGPEVLEIKCPENIDTVEYMNDKWLRYRLQVEMCMRCVGARRGHIFVYHDRQGFKHWEVQPDDVLWDLCEKEMDRFEQWVQLKVEPPVQSTREKAAFLDYCDSKRSNGQASSSVGHKRRRSLSSGQ